MARTSRNASAWIDTAVFYEIYPQTFCDSNGDGIGDLPGIISKLDYVKSLNVDAIWLNPCYVSPFRDAGYDVADFCKVDPRYGTNADMKRLFREAAKRGMRVILDFVPGHTSIDHPWFKASAKPTANKYTNWYVWTDNVWGMKDPEFASKMVHGWSDRNGNVIINYFWHQPALNFGFGKPEKPWQLPVSHPDVQALHAEMKNVLRFWLDMGASGFRVDMAGSLIRKDPGAREIRAFWQGVRRMLDKEYPGTFMVSEWSHPITAIDAGFDADFYHWTSSYDNLFRKESWRSLNGLVDGHSWFDRKGEGDISRFIKDYMVQYEGTRGRGHVSVPVGNHDLSRVNIRHTQTELEMIQLFGLTMPGVPFLYYGDEIGMRHLDGIQAGEGAYRPRSGARTSMQWTSGRNAGFSTAPASKLLMPVDPAADAPNVSAQQNDPRSLLNTMRMMIDYRRTMPCLKAGAAFKPLYVRENAYPFVLLRTEGKQAVLVALNPAAKPVTVSVDTGVKCTRAVQEFGGKVRIETEENGKCVITMPGVSYALWELVG